MKNWTRFNFENFWFLMFFILGIIAGLLFPRNIKSTKKYPIEVRCYWTTDGYQSYPSMEADSVKGDTIWKDGLNIVNKNIINVNFK